LTSDSTEAEIASALESFCADAAADINRQALLDAHEDELVPQVQKLGDDQACVVIEVCTQEELAQNKAD
jgi:hypothetical protein